MLNGKREDCMYHELKVFGFAVDPLSPKPVVLLKGGEGDSVTVPIWVSTLEAVAMAAELVNREVTAQRGRHDLLSELMGRLEVTVMAISLEQEEHGVAAAVHFLKDGEEVKIGVRTCEALVASIKFKLPIQVSHEVVARSALEAVGAEGCGKNAEERRYADFLENLDPAELGKYPM